MKYFTEIKIFNITILIASLLLLALSIYNFYENRFLFSVHLLLASIIGFYELYKVIKNKNFNCIKKIFIIHLITVFSLYIYINIEILISAIIILGFSSFFGLLGKIPEYTTEKKVFCYLILAFLVFSFSIIIKIFILISSATPT